MRHTMAYREVDADGTTGIRLDYKPVVVDPLPADGAQVLMTTSTGRSAAQDGRKVGEVPSFDVTLRIRRYNPEVDAEPHWEDYRVTVHGTDRRARRPAQDQVGAGRQR